MTIQQFIEAAIEGSYDYKTRLQIEGIQKYNDQGKMVSWEEEDYIRTIQQDDFERMILDPEAWKAVGKVKGWENIEMSMYDITQENDRWGYKAVMKPQWMWFMQKMIQELCTGKTLEEYIATL